MVEDFHVHSTYSDGNFLWSMLGAAEEAELDGLGIADHCNVSARDRPQRFKKAMGFNLDRTYQRRRDAIVGLRERTDMRLYDGVELDYDPRDESEIRQFLDGADFEYAIGSVHTLDETNVHYQPYFEQLDEGERVGHVETYFDRLVQLIDSDLFEIAAHVDVVERNTALRGYATDDQYRRVAEAFADSRTVPELNAGRVLDEYGEFHPSPRFLEVLQEYDVPFVLGSDAHDPDEIAPRHTAFRQYLDDIGLTPTTFDL